MKLSPWRSWTLQASGRDEPQTCPPGPEADTEEIEATSHEKVPYIQEPGRIIAGTFQYLHTNYPTPFHQRRARWSPCPYLILLTLAVIMADWIIAPASSPIKSIHLHD
ncbi:hypothetical protein ILYODFUR_017568 [Ilyodon furcidens]|uniref:Uncharacterized protein n=1 Tax=Ilyodon furcidens TaxID=33524 RepID=A0ABV0UH61_9TELE